MINKIPNIKKQNSVGIIIPTYNGGKRWLDVVCSLKEQKNCFDEILIIDSGSTDDTVKIAKDANFNILAIESSEFNHGGTRNLGAENIDCDILVFITQDAIPEKDAILKITKVFENPNVAVAYGRQISHLDANPIAEHARNFNYKNTSYIYSIEDKDKHGIKTVFASNSFAAYRKSFFIEIGKFPNNTIFAEDMFFTAKALIANYKVTYVADAIVRHSHNYSFMEEFRRSFDTGVFHKQEIWIREIFGEPGGEGIRFVKSEFLFLMKGRKPFLIPRAFFNNFFKILGFKLGLSYKNLPYKIIKYCSMNKKYWNN